MGNWLIMSNDKVKEMMDKVPGVSYNKKIKFLLDIYYKQRGINHIIGENIREEDGDIIEEDTIKECSDEEKKEMLETEVAESISTSKEVELNGQGCEEDCGRGTEHKEEGPCSDTHGTDEEDKHTTDEVQAVHKTVME